MTRLAIASACLQASCESVTYVSTGATGRITGLWEGASLEVTARTDETNPRTLVRGSDLRPGSPATDAVDFELGIDGPDGTPYELAVDHVATGFTCQIISGGSGVIGEPAVPAEIRCTPPVDGVTVSAAPDWRFDAGAVAQTAPVPASAGSASVLVSGWSLTRVMIDGVDTPTGIPSRERFLSLGANAITLEIHAGYATRSFELTIERSGLSAPAARRLAPVPDPYHEFGRAIAADGDRVAVAAYDLVYVFRVVDGEWQPEATIESEYPRALALAGDTLAVGMETVDGGVVEVHRTDDTGWHLEQRLTGASLAAGNSFGTAVALFADTLVVGAPLVDVPASPPTGRTIRSGAAYVYRRGADGWLLDARLVAPNAGELDLFGTSVAISFNVVAIGAPFEDGCDGGVHADIPDGEGCVNSGAVYTFMRLGTWEPQSYIKAPMAWTNTNFGTALAYGGEHLVVGAPQEPSEERWDEVPGALYVLRSRDPLAAVPWQSEARLASQIPDAGLGLRVALRDGVVVASSRAEAGELSGAGAVQLFAIGDGGWQPRGLFKTARPDHDEGLGRAVAVAPHAVLASAAGHDGPGVQERDVGAVYELRLEAP